MARNNHVISIIEFSVILSIFKGEACLVSHQAKEKISLASSPFFFHDHLPFEVPPSFDCATQFIISHMEATATRSREFVQNEMVRHLEDPRVIESNRECLMTCFKGYQSTICSITSGISEISQSNYVGAIEDVVQYSLTIAPCMKCSSEISFQDLEFMSFQKWAKSAAEDLHNKLKSCRKQLSPYHL